MAMLTRPQVAELLRGRDWGTETRPRYRWRLAELYVGDAGLDTLTAAQLGALEATLLAYPVATPERRHALAEAALCIADNAAEARLAATER